MHLHLDPVGGLSGDMFIAALLDAQPELEQQLPHCLRAIGLEHKVSVSRSDHNNGILTGSRVQVTELSESTQEQDGHAHTHSHTHQHHHFSDIRKLLLNSALTEPVQQRAIDIFTRLAQAEAQVHGMLVEDVAFHEVGALDSIADITLAAYLIEALGNPSFSVSTIPMGSGRINCQHGTLPVPAPATLLLLRGLPLFDDGIPGERVTPTGAAILNHLQPAVGGPVTGMTLTGSGVGFGTATLPGLPNILRAMLFTLLPQSQHDEISVFEFEVDDQTPEDLAVGLQYLRELPAVLDVLATAVTTKKNRLAQSIRILGQPAQEQNIINACYEQTTTLGVRHYRCARSILPRREVQFDDGTRIKIAQRPSGYTAKVDMDDLAKLQQQHAPRTAQAHELANTALQKHIREQKS